jgi:hypothetical protein
MMRVRALMIDEDIQRRISIMIIKIDIEEEEEGMKETEGEMSLEVEEGLWISGTLDLILLQRTLIFSLKPQMLQRQWGLESPMHLLSLNQSRLFKNRNLKD